MRQYQQKFNRNEALDELILDYLIYNRAKTPQNNDGDYFTQSTDAFEEDYQDYKDYVYHLYDMTEETENNDIWKDDYNFPEPLDYRPDMYKQPKLPKNPQYQAPYTPIRPVPPEKYMVPDMMPKIPSMPQYGNDNYTVPKMPSVYEPKMETGVLEETEFMKLIYSELAKKFMPYITEVLNSYEYEGSPLFGKQVDKGTVVQIVDKVIEKAKMSIEAVDEITLDLTKEGWGRNHILRALVECLALAEIYICRRPRKKRCREYK